MSQPSDLDPITGTPLQSAFKPMLWLLIPFVLVLAYGFVS